MGDMFLKLEEPEIWGESVDEAAPKAHWGEIEISGWSWGLENPDSKAAEGKDEPTKTNVHSIIVHKYYDSASLGLIGCCANKTNIEKGTITCRKNDGNKPRKHDRHQKLDYLVIKLQDVKIRTINWPTPTDEVIPEELELVFTKFYVSYTPQSNEGGDRGIDIATGSITFGWDVTKNKEDHSLASI